MKNLYTIILLTLLSLLMPSLAAAQSFQNVGIADASTVYSIAQDEQGIMWFGTDHGLYAYDGYRSIPHNTDADGTPVIMRVHSICIFKDMLYMATERGLMAYDIRRGRYAERTSGDKGEMRAVTIYGGRLWYGGAQGLFSQDLQTGTKRTENSRLHNVYSLLPTRHGLLVGTLTGLTVLRNGKAQPIRIGEGSQPLVNALLGDGGLAWIGTEGALYRYDGKRLENISSLSGNSVKSLSVYAGLIYAGTDNGLYIYNKKDKTVRHALHDSRSPHSIANNIVWAVFSDRWGNLWAGTDQGVSDLRKRRFYDYIPLSDLTNTGEGNCLHLIYRGLDGRMWLGGTNGLITYGATHGYMPDDMNGITWFRQSSQTHYMSHNRVRRVYTDTDGRVLVCTDHGINIYNPQTRKMRNVIVTDPSRRYTTAWAYDIIDDGKGRYWICSYMGGVFVISKKKLLGATTPTVMADRHFLKELQGMHVLQLVKDGRGRIYARVYDRGLDRISSATMRVEHLVGKDRLVNDLIVDRRGNVWAAMKGEVRCFGPESAADRSLHITGYDAADAAMLCEVEGNVWAVMGLDCCILGKDGKTTRFAVPGFRSLAICYDPVSRSVLLGGNDALVSIPIANVIHGGTDKGHRGKLFLSGVMVDGKQFTSDEGYPTYLSEMTLTARQNNVTFQLTDLPQSGQQPCVYAYRLKGVDRTWQYIHGERLDISYNALPPGDYTLEVRLVDGQGEAKEEVMAYGVTILPPWYLSVWAKIVYLIILICLVVWVMKFWMMRRRLREEREAKERIMQESTARSQFFDNLSVQLKKPLTSLFGAVLNMLRAENDTANMRSLENMRRDVVDINSLMYKALDMQQTSDRKASVATTTVDIADFCRRAAEDARAKYGKTVEIGYRTNVPKVYADLDVARLQLVIDQLIDFAARNRAADSAVSIAVSADKDKVDVVVGIPGLTIAEADMPFVFNRYFSVGGNAQTADVNTLALVNEFAKQNGAQAAVDSDNEGTDVTMTFASAYVESAGQEAADSKPMAAKKNDADSVDARLLAKITDMVEAHIADSDFNVTRLQESLEIGSKLLYRKVKQMTGKTPVEFIRHIRLQRASVLLREGRFSVSEVMYMVGFSNSSYFSKCFQKAYGITPAEYARQ